MLGIEPAENVAAAAQQRGIQTLVQFFGEGLAKQLVAHGTQADLIVGNNVLAHVPATQRLCEWPEVAAETARCDHDGVSTPVTAHGGEAIRYDLS